jgi:DNA-binding XRE family transcriptional regulator/GTPase SAR1 family protein
MENDEKLKKLRREFGGELAMLRGRTGMTQEQLAAIIGVNSVTLRYWEIGKYVPKAPSLQLLISTLAVRGFFSAGKELEEIRKLWNTAKEAGLKDALDEEWLAELCKECSLPVAKLHKHNGISGNTQEPTINASARVDEQAKSRDEYPVQENNSSSQLNEAQSFAPYKGEHFFKYQDRQRMLDKIDSIWIKGLLDESLENVVEIELELQEQPDVVEPSWKQYQYLQEVRRPRKEVASRLHILNAYEHAHHKLLILGEPGSGKTTLLLQLTRILLERARSDTTHPIPVIYSLASWAKKRLNIEEWLIEELNTQYHIPHTLGQQWTDEKQLLPLFDGLDEVDPAYYSSCIEALNLYLKEHGLVPTIICSRRNEYLNQPKRLLLQNAVLVQPLTEKQIDVYMRKIRLHKKEIYDMLSHDLTLRTPLMLRMFSTAYEDGETETTDMASTLDIQKQAFAMYILQMFKRRPSNVHYNLQQTIKYLQWLARQLDQHNQRQFYIEFMQLTWLPAYPLRQLYPAIAVALAYGLLSSFGFSISYLPYFSFSQVIIFFLLIATFNTCLYSFFNGILFGVLADNQEKEEAPASSNRQPYASIRRKMIAILGNRAIYGILNGLFDGIFVGLIVGPVSGWICGLFSCLFCAALGKLDAEIKCAEYLKWSGSSMLYNAHKFLAGGLLVGLLYGLVTGRDYLFTPAKLFPALLLGLGIGLLVGLVMSIRGGFTYNIPDTDKILKPNQGILQSVRNSLFFGTFFGTAFGILFGLIYGPVLFLILGQEYRSSFPANSGLVYGISDGLIVAAFFWLVSGGVACIQHGLLRLLLWIHGSIPWNYAHFLDRAVDLALLQKLGGGYIFFHRLLQEYFSTLDDTQIKILMSSFSSASLRKKFRPSDDMQ